jgi:hypothetical protein
MKVWHAGRRGRRFSARGPPHAVSLQRRAVGATPRRRRRRPPPSVSPVTDVKGRPSGRPCACDPAVGRSSATTCSARSPTAGQPAELPRYRFHSPGSRPGLPDGSPPAARLTTRSEGGLVGDGGQPWRAGGRLEPRRESLNARSSRRPGTAIQRPRSVPPDSRASTRARRSASCSTA